MAKRSTYRARLDELAQQVGHGKLVGRHLVNQPYAAKQHQERTYRHPRGGGPHFVSDALVRNQSGWYRAMAEGLLSGRAYLAMADGMESLARATSTDAPVEFGRLRASGHPSVYDGGRVVYDRPPVAPRASARSRRGSR
jgi:hypothetical protein